MGTKKESTTLPPCFGEAFVDDFFFSSMMNDNGTYKEDEWSAKQRKDYMY
jgi:hypothetical protein